MPSSAHLVQKRAKQRRRRALKVTIDFFLEGLVALCLPWSEGAIMKPDMRLLKKLDQGAPGMSDPCGTLPLALKPNAVPRINCLLSNFYFCAN